MRKTISRISLITMLSLLTACGGGNVAENLPNLPGGGNRNRT